MELFSYDEIKSAFDSLLQGKLRNKRKSYALEYVGHKVNGENVSLLPVGTDGITTIHVLKDENSLNNFLKEIYRLTNECYPGTDVPRIEVKKYKIKEIAIDETKSRTIVIPCLRDQVVVRCVLNKLNQLILVDEENRPNQKIDVLTRKIRNSILEKPGKKMLRTDISNFYPSVNVDKLLDMLTLSHGNLLDDRLLQLIRKILVNNKSAGLYNGLPVGVGFCVLLANYYISRMKLSLNFPGIELVRYEDDLLFIMDKEVDESMVLKKLDQIFSQFSLKRNVEKTEVMDALAEFKFLGVYFNKGFVSTGEEKIKQWKTRVNEDIRRQFKEIDMVKILYPDLALPSNKDLVNIIWRAHLTGERSKVFKHANRIRKINEEKIS